MRDNMINPKRCPNGCCIYDPGDESVGIAWAWWYCVRCDECNEEIYAVVEFCPEDGSRLNSNGSCDSGDVVWGDWDKRYQ